MLSNAHIGTKKEMENINQVTCVWVRMTKMRSPCCLRNSENFCKWMTALNLKSIWSNCNNNKMKNWLHRHANRAQIVTKLLKWVKEISKAKSFVEWLYTKVMLRWLNNRGHAKHTTDQPKEQTYNRTILLVATKPRAATKPREASETRRKREKEWRNKWISWKKFYKSQIIYLHRSVQWNKCFRAFWKNQI